MKTLYIDTHSDCIQFLLFSDGKLQDCVIQDASCHHSSLLMPLLDQLFQRAKIVPQDIHDIIVVNGPGSFTGIRLGVTIAKTFAYTLDVPIRVMSSLLVKAVSNGEKGFHWFAEKEKNGYFVGEFNDSDELLNDYFYIPKSEFARFQETRDIILDVPLNYEAIYQYSRKINPINPHNVNPLYVKLIEVQR